MIDKKILAKKVGLVLLVASAFTGCDKGTWMPKINDQEHRVERDHYLMTGQKFPLSVTFYTIPLGSCKYNK